MTDTVDAVVTRARGIGHAGKRYADGAVITLAAGQFDDWRSLGWVDHATPDQIEAAKVAAEKAEAVAAERAAKKAAKSKAAKSA